MSNKKAVIDRILEDKAVLLIGDAEIEVVVAVEQLPESAKVGDWLNVSFNGEEIANINIDEKETDVVKARIQSKMELLRQRSGSRFKK